MSSFTGNDLMAGPPPTLLPEDPASAELVPGADAMDVVRRHPDSPVAWATLATLAAEAEDDAVTIYAYARVGYHRSLDMLRRNGWKGHGPVPWEHEPNRGFLTCLALLALAARAIGEDAEWERCSEFLRDSSADRRTTSCSATTPSTPDATQRLGRAASAAAGPCRHPAPGTASAAADRARRRPAGCRAAGRSPSGRP